MITCQTEVHGQTKVHGQTPAQIQTKAHDTQSRRLSLVLLCAIAGVDYQNTTSATTPSTLQVRTSLWVPLRRFACSNADRKVPNLLL